MFSTHSPRPLAAAIAFALGCSPDAKVDIPIGPITEAVTLPVDGVPSALLDGERRVISVDCGAAMPCPALPTSEVSITCVSDRCVLGAFTLRTSNQRVDLGTFSTFQEYAGALQAVSLRRAQLGFTGLRTGNAVGPLELTWSADADEAGASARRLATLPRTALTSATQEVELALDLTEVQSLARQVLAGTRRFRVRIAGPVEAGAGALPAARVELSLRLLFHVDTSL